MIVSLPRTILPLSLLLIMAAPAALADGAPTQRLLTVSGSGEVKAAPDRAELSTGVVTRERSAAAALAGNARAMNAVFDTLKRAGIAEKDIQTSNSQVSPQYSAEKPGTNAPQRIAGYEVSDTVTVTVTAPVRPLFWGAAPARCEKPTPHPKMKAIANFTCIFCKRLGMATNLEDI